MASNEAHGEVGEAFNPDSKKEEDKRLRELKAANLRAVFGSGAGRLAAFAVGGVLVTMIVIGGFKLFGKKSEAPQIQQAGPDAVLQSPGAQGGDQVAASEREAQMRREFNQQQAASASQSGSVFIAPPVLKADANAPKLGGNDLAKSDSKAPASPEEQHQKLVAQQQAATSAADAAGQAQAQQQRREQEYAEMKQLRDTIKKDDVMPQVQVALGMGWKGEPVKTFATSYYTLPDRTKAAQASTAPAAGGGATATAQETQSPPMFQAGDACYGAVDYNINTDSPGNQVVATMYPCRGVKVSSKVIGKYEVKDQVVSFSFDKLAIPGKPQIAIQAMAINEQTWETGLADDVDNHYLRRFVGPALASILVGLGQAAQLPVGTTTSTGFGTTSQTIQTQTDMTPGRQAKIALGVMGQQVGAELSKDAQSIKPTIKVYGSKDGKKGIGIVFLADVYEAKK